MTRINLVPPEELHQKHLVAEYREIVRIFSLVRSGQNKKKWKIPPEYVLGRGHVTFFYDKLSFILNRYKCLTSEMIRRGYSPNPISEKDLTEGVDRKWFGCYTPTPSALAANRERISQRTPKAKK